ncbi:eukaryotic translation initiation factor 4 gamma 3-like isoform X2 [Acipenser ruthenus]|uniref:eukaryotic translation initiation factor 4 gamma 3-like isoform X2 n=1 Tax=Acipenser ruthenus TaxID=7906 RepID=UPI00145BEA15|nr:eukaryotic translation initiation factor 4 gamma 3-like isoform X2 [Acipenser ruthenus]
MSLPPRAVPKSAAAAGSGSGTGLSPPSQLRALPTSVPVPGAPAAPQPPVAPPPQVFLNVSRFRIPRGQQTLEDRIFPTQATVAAVFGVPRQPAPPYAAHELNKGHPSLAATPSGHTSTPGLSQVSVSTAHLYRCIKGWESVGGSPYTSGQNAAAAPPVYLPQQPMNAQPQSRPFAAGPRPAHHQFFQRSQMQTARATIPSNSPSIRPGSQNPTPAVYPPNQPIMMTMTAMPFPSPQGTQYYIPQYRHSTPYVGPPQQYSVQPPGPNTFYPGPGPGEFPTPYGAPYYTGQTVYSPSPPIIVPTPQQPPPAKREKKTIRIRDPNQGGKDITEEIMSGGGGSRNTTPPVGRPSSTPTPPQFLCPHPHYPHIFYLKSQQLSSQAPDHGHVMYSVENQLTPTAVDFKPEEKPKQDPAVLKSSSPGLRHDLSAEKRDHSVTTQDLSPLEKPSELPLVIPTAVSTPASSPSAATVPIAVTSKPAFTVDRAESGSQREETSPSVSPQLSDTALPDPPRSLSASPAIPTSAVAAAVVKEMNGVSEKEATSPCSDVDIASQEPVLLLLQTLPPPLTANAESQETHSREAQAASPSPPAHAASTCSAILTSTASAALIAAAAPLPILQLVNHGTVEAGEGRRTPISSESKEVGDVDIQLEETLDSQPPNSRKSPIPAQTAPAEPKTWKKPKEGTGGRDEVLDADREPEPREEGSVEQALEAEPHRPSPVPVEMEKQQQQQPVPEENGERELEPVRNGAEHVSESESTDSGATTGDKDSSTGAPQCIFQEASLDTEGKKQYDREFLLGFQFMAACVQKPEGLPQINDVVLDKINQNKLPMRPLDPRVMSRGPDFTPAFADFSRQIAGGRGAAMLSAGLRRSQQGQRREPRKIITNVSVNEVQLKKAENAWKPTLKRDEEPCENKTQDLFRKVRSILNKLTPQMFNQLMKQVTDLTIDTEERLKGVIDLVFEKAVDEPSFSVAYGNMCRCLATLKVTMTDKPNSTVNFRKLLLNRCQKEFERDKVDDDVFERKQKELEAAASSSERERLQEELKEAKDKARRRSIGNIKFIGELFKLKMLTEAIMHDCVVKLLKNHDEESLECLCRLLTTIGKDLDFEKAKPRMDQYFNQMEKIVKERKTSSRIRFMLQDVIDLRLHNWVSRRVDQGPKTIEQIHKEAKIEEQEEQRKVHQQLLSKDKRRPVLQREETWNTVPMSKNSRTIDPSKIPKISKPTIDDKIQLGPRAQMSWGKGSSGGAKASESDASRSSTTNLNRFSALQSSAQPAIISPPTTPASEFDSRRSLTSRSSTGRERNDKPVSTALSQPATFTRGSSNKELLDNQVQEEQPREAHETVMQLPTGAEEKTDTDTDRSGAYDTGKPDAPAAPAADKPAITEEEMERKSKSIIDEFLHINDYKEAVQCVKELCMPSMLHMFVRVGVESTLERSQITRDHMGQLLFQLVQSGSLSTQEFFKGFAETLEFADDMAIDVPHIWLYLAELVIPMFREGGISMRELLSEFSKPLLPVGRAGVLLSEILHQLCKQMSQRKVGALWRESGLNWIDFLPEEEDVHNFISDQKLQFTLSDCSSPPESLSKRDLSPDELNRQLEKLLEDIVSDEQIFDWVEANLEESQMSSTPFLRALMTAVCKAAVKGNSTTSRVDTAIIQRRLPVLLKYLNSDTEKQLQALYALQALIVKLDQPPNLLRMFFDCLYDEDVISEDAFYKWEVSKDPGELEGKGVALKSVTAFFTWLREAEEESEDN